MTDDLGRRLVAELVGTAFLVAVVVGSGIAAARLSSDAGIRLLENSLATGAGLIALILVFAPVSGARFNPTVTMASIIDGATTRRDGAAEMAVQTIGAVVGAIGANVMFDLPAISWSTAERASTGQRLGEVVATFGLVTVVLGVGRSRHVGLTAVAVGGYLAAAYWFTSSTAFANPAATIGRMFSDTFAGIGPSSVPAFLLAQLTGAALAIAFGHLVFPRAAPR